jgi:hypothetical protein
MSRTLVAAVAFAALALAVSGPMTLDARQGTRPSSPAATAAPAPSQAAVDRAAPLPGARSPRNASYSIDVRLDHRSKSLSGRAVLTWRNITNRAVTELPFHLYYNAWRNTRSTWMRENESRHRAPVRDRQADEWGWIEVSAIRLITSASQLVDLTARRTYIAPDDGNPDDRTVMSVPLPTPVQPGETVNVELAWTSKVPRTFARTGVVGSSYFIAQWFPKVGVLEDTGWNCHQFHAGTEFFSDYGVYDVRMTVPKGWVIGATGREQQRTENADGTATHTYHAEDVHDFAWTTSPDLLEYTATFEHPRLPAVKMRLLLQPEHQGQEGRYFEGTRTTLRYYGEWFGAYPYGYITIVDPAWQSGAGGMEYPTLFTGGTSWLAPRDVSDPEGVTVHEAGHQFWYAIVGNNEFEHAWIDEGLNTFSTARAIDANPALRVNYFSQRAFGGFIPWVFRDIPLSREIDGNDMGYYRGSAKADVPATPSFLYYPATGGGLTYSKTALWLHTLERYIGWPALQKVLSTFYARWQFRHPKPADFFAIVNEVTGRDMTWFFDQVYRSSNTFDYGVASATSVPVTGKGLVEDGGKMVPITQAAKAVALRTTVVVRRYGEAVFPVDVEVVFSNGEKVVEHWNGRDRWKAFTYERANGFRSVTVDPTRVLLLDVDYTNNSIAADPHGGAAARRWAQRWMIWLQDAMLTYASFI